MPLMIDPMLIIQARSLVFGFVAVHTKPGKTGTLATRDRCRSSRPRSSGLEKFVTDKAAELHVPSDREKR
jgi:hypothetical protein